MAGLIDEVEAAEEAQRIRAEVAAFQVTLRRIRRLYIAVLPALAGVFVWTSVRRGVGWSASMPTITVAGAWFNVVMVPNFVKRLQQLGHIPTTERST
jgi:peptidoglycan/LPS O-acetylase OafA/YrhL